MLPMTYAKHPLVRIGPLSFRDLHLLSMRPSSGTGYHSESMGDLSITCMGDGVVVFYI